MNVQSFVKLTRPSTVAFLRRSSGQQFLAISHFLLHRNSFHSNNIKLSATFSTSIDYFGGNVADDQKLQFGDYALMASQGQVQRKFINVEDIEKPNAFKSGDRVWIRGRVSAVRMKGNACFLTIRNKSFSTIQICHFKDKSQAELSKELMKFAGALPLESIVDIYGEMAQADVKSCSVKNLEIHMKKIFTVSRAPVQLPFLLDDAARPQAIIDASANSEKPFHPVSQENRLDNRWLDLRVPANNAIMRVRSGISQLFREYLFTQKFVEINTPKLLPGESEGGSEVFRTDYFGKPACLAQSPQLYKQMAISSDLDRVFEIGPVFRAENSNTRRHLCEFTGLDVEMAIDSHYNETLEVMHGLFRHIFEGLETRFARELTVIREQYPSEAVMFTKDPLIIHWWDAIDLLRKAGHQAEDFEDLNTNQEIILGKIVKEKFNTDFYIVDQYPSKIRPFYTMPNLVDGNYSNSYDIFLRGQEICSGAQRCHDATMLEERIKAKGMETTPLESYINSFRHGIYPHAGAGIGLDRVVFLYLGLDNVRKASMFPRDPNRFTP